MADEMNQNVAILSLVAALKDNTKELTANVKKQITQVEKNAGEINFTGNTEDIQNKLKEIVGLLNKELKGVNTAKYLQPILEVFSDATKSAEEYTAAVNETINSMKDLAKIGTGTSAKVRKGIKEGLPHLNQRDIAKALTLQKQLEQAIIKSEGKISQAKEKYKNIEASSLASLRKLYNTEERYISSIGDEAVSNLASKMGIQSPSTDVTRDLKEFSELISLFEILKQKKEELSNSKFDLANEEELKKAQSVALENIETTKTLASLYDQIEKKREKLSSKYNIQDTAIGLPENYHPINIRDILTVNNDYVEKIKEETKKSIDKAENELASHVKERAEKRKASADAEFNKSMQNLNRTTAGGTGGTGSAKEGIENVGNAANNAKGSVDDLGDALGDLGDDKSGSDNELDLWAKSADNLKDQFADVIQYAKSVEEALERVNELLNSRTALSKSETVEALNYIQRLYDLDNEEIRGNDKATEFYNKYSKSPIHSKQLDSITKMTKAQLAEIERLKSAKSDIDKKDSSSKNNSFKESSEDVTELTQRVETLETTISEMQTKLTSLDGNSFQRMQNDISNVKQELEETVAKLKELKSLVGDKTEAKLAKGSFTTESGQQMFKVMHEQLNLLNTVTEYHEKVKETNAYLQKGNDIIEERAILMKNGLQVGKEYVMSDATGKVNIGGGINKYGADSVLHTHAFSDKVNNLRFSDADIQELVDGTIKKALLLCGNEIATLDMTDVKPSDFESLRTDILGAYKAVFARFGAEVKDGKLVGIDSLPPEVQNQATDIVNNLIRNIMKNYGGDLYFDAIDDDKEFIANDDVRLPKIDESELAVVQRYLEAVASDKPIENIIALQKQFGILKAEIKKAKEEVEAAADAIVKVQSFKVGKDSVTGVGYHGAKTAWKTDNFDFSKVKAAQLGTGMYFTDDLEQVASFGKGQIKQTELSLEKCFIITNDYMSNVADVYKAMGKEIPQAEVTAKKVLSEIRTYNKTSKENSESFRQNMLSMGYQGMYVGDHLANVKIASELIVYDESKLDKLVSFTNKEFQELKGNAKPVEIQLPAIPEKLDESFVLSSPAQEFDNEIQKNLVNLENYKNTIKEIDALKLEPETEETKRKIEELIELSKYFLKNISVLKSEGGYEVSIAGFKDNFGSFSRGLKDQYPDNVLSEMYDIGKGNSGLRYSAIKSEFSGISEEIQKIESKSEELRNSLRKDLTDSLKYIKDLKHSFIRLVASQEELKTETNPKWIEGFNKDIDKALKKFPELEQFKDKFTTEDQALKFVKTDEWNDFLATLPQAKAYLESINIIQKEKQVIDKNGEGNQTPLSSPALFEDESGQLSFVAQTKKTVDLIEEESGQMAMFENIAEKATDSAIEGQMELNDYINKNIDGQMTLNDLVSSNSKKDLLYDFYKQKYPNLQDKDIQNAVDKSKDRIITSLTRGNTAMGDGYLGNFIESEEKAIQYAEALKQELLRIGYTLENSVYKDTGEWSAKIVPIDKNAITNAEQMRDILFDINRIKKESNTSTDYSSTSDIKAETEAIEDNTGKLRKNRQEQENNANVKTDQPENLRKRLESIFENAVELKRVLKSLDEGTSFSFDWSDDDGYQKINLFKKALKEFGYTVKDVKEDTDSFSYSGKIVSVKNDPDQIDSVAKAYEEATEVLKKYYDLKQKEYSKGNVEDNDILKSYKEELKDAIAHIGKYAAITEEAIKAQKKFDAVVNDYKNDFSSDIQADLNSKFSSYENKKNKTSEYYEIIKNIRSEIDKLKVPIDFTNTDEIKELASTEKHINDMMKDLVSRNNKEFNLVPEDKINNALNTAYKTLNKNTAAPKELRNNLKQVIAEFEKLKKSGEEVNEVTFDKLQNSLKEVQLEINKTGKTGASMVDKIQKKFGDVAAYFATYVSIQDGLQALRQAYQYVAEIDKQMIELEKVSNMSGPRLGESFEHAKDAAADLGSTVSDVIAATADWSRLGMKYCPLI